MNATTSSISRPMAAEREFLFTDADFRRISQLIFKHAGISLSAAKVEMVYNRLARRLRLHGFSSFAAYLDFLEQSGQAEWSAFIGALTTHMTSFFREQHHFPILSAHLAHRPHQEKLQLWSCAASTGEEPYSMAITAAEAFGTLSPPVCILATDVDQEVLAEASDGIYPMERVGHMDQQLLKRYFEWGSGKHKGSVRVRPELRRLITFQTLNLADPVWPMKESYDAIFCRNVMIYFDRSTQKEILARSQRHLKPDGLYFAGHSENLNFADHLFAPCGQTVYRQHAVAHREKTVLGADGRQVGRPPTIAP